ncbi:MAG: hypothetical protein ACI9MC_001568 [Kiritimatiellia bacterium]
MIDACWRCVARTVFDLHVQVTPSVIFEEFVEPRRQARHQEGEQQEYGGPTGAITAELTGRTIHRISEDEIGLYPSSVILQSAARTS